MELNKLDLNKLNVFYTVAQSGGLAGASEKLLLTRSALSQSLGALEKSLDVNLFHRVGKKLILTEEGRRLYTEFHQYQAGLQKTVQNILAHRQEIRGIIRIGLHLGFDHPRFSDFIASFCRKHPKVDFKFVYRPPTDLSQLVLQNRIDLAVSVVPSPFANKIKSIRLFKEELILVGAKGHYKKKFTPEDLRATPIVDYYQARPLINDWARHHFKKVPKDLKVRVFAATTNLVCELILAHAGVGVLPRSFAQPHIDAGRLVGIKTDQKELEDNVWLYENRESRPGLAVERFKLDWLALA